VCGNMGDDMGGHDHVRMGRHLRRGDVTRKWYNVGSSIKESPAPGWRHSPSTFFDGVRVMACDVT